MFGVLQPSPGARIRRFDTVVDQYDDGGFERRIARNDILQHGEAGLVLMGLKPHFCEGDAERGLIRLIFPRELEMPRGFFEVTCVAREQSGLVVNARAARAVFEGASDGAFDGRAIVGPPQQGAKSLSA